MSRIGGALEFARDVNLTVVRMIGDSPSTTDAYLMKPAWTDHAR